MASKSGRTNWTPETHLDLLLAIFNHAQLTQAQWDNVISQVHRQGYNYTQSAATQHLSKLRAKENNGTGNATGDSGSVPATPKKGGGKGAKATPGSTTGKRKAKQKVPRDSLDDGDDIVDDDESPTKKIKKEKSTDANQESSDAKHAKSLFGPVHDDEV
ncbi:hypothetical protein F4775DRAFT_588425 [Biscogniauxia sp. FL1348]|nr:hypothetical protein F4775DRAFT_588425 [Biscogniauxia sp. FL1348]